MKRSIYCILAVVVTFYCVEQLKSTKDPAWIFLGYGLPSILCFIAWPRGTDSMERVLGILVAIGLTPIVIDYFYPEAGTPDQINIFLLLLLFGHFCATLTIWWNKGGKAKTPD